MKITAANDTWSQQGSLRSDCLPWAGPAMRSEEGFILLGMEILWEGRWQHLPEPVRTTQLSSQRKSFPLSPVLCPAQLTIHQDWGPSSQSLPPHQDHCSDSACSGQGCPLILPQVHGGTVLSSHQSKSLWTAALPSCISTGAFGHLSRSWIEELNWRSSRADLVRSPGHLSPGR